MKKNAKITSLMAAMITTTAVLPATAVLASESNPTVNNTNQVSEESVNQLLSDTTISIANQYISFDNVTNEFIIDSSTLAYILPEEELSLVISQVEDTNKKIQEILQLENIGMNVRAVDTDGDKIILNQIKTRSWGKNDIEFYWNFARIYIDAGNVRLALQAGFTIGSVYAPARIISAVLGVLGVASSNIKHGIWFDYNYFIGVLCGNCGLQ